MLMGGNNLAYEDYSQEFSRPHLSNAMDKAGLIMSQRDQDFELSPGRI